MTEQTNDPNDIMSDAFMKNLQNLQQQMAAKQPVIMSTVILNDNFKAASDYLANVNDLPAEK